MKIIVEIDNITEPQRLAIIDLFAQWQNLGGLGGSRWTAFYADGDGDFRPKIKVDGERPRICCLTDPDKRWKQLYGEDGSVDIYMLDFDAIAWALHKEAKGER